MDVKPTTDPIISTRKEEYPGLSAEDQILAEARDRINYGWTYWQDNYDASELDREFLAGNQWPEDIAGEREENNRPMLTINKLTQFVSRVANDMLQNPTQIKVHPTTANAAEESTKLKSLTGNADYSVAEVYNALIADIEYNSNAEAHYARSTEHMVGGGLAWLRAYTAYCSDSGFDVDLRIASPRNPTSAMIDPDACEPDWSDAVWGVTFEQIPRAEFDKRWPDADVGDLSQFMEDNKFDWGRDGYVTICEYMTLEPQKYWIFKMSNGEVWDGRDLGSLPKRVESGWFIDNPDNLSVTKARQVMGHKCVWRKITANTILEGGEKGVRMPFSTVPLVPMFGREVAVRGRRNFESLIRHALDSQREFNYWRTAMAEMVALQPKQPYVGTAFNFENREADWASANTKNHAYLTYNPDPENGGAPPIRQPLSQSAAAEMQNAMAADESMKAAMGMYDASLGNVSREESGRAILARERQSDIGTYHFTASRNRAVARLGKLLVEGIQKIYTDDRVVRLRFEDNSEDFVRINYSLTEINGKELMFNDITQAKFDVRVSAGPSYNTLRVEAVNSLIEFIQAVPSAGAAAQDIIARNMDFPGAEELAERLKRAVPPQLLDEEDAEEIQPPPPDPNLELQMAIEQAKNQGKELDIAEQELQNQAKALEVEKARFEAQSTGFDEAKLQQMIVDALAEIEIGKMQERMAQTGMEPPNGAPGAPQSSV